MMVIKLILFDWAGTLIQGAVPFPHAGDALKVLSRFSTADGEKIKLGLIFRSELLVDGWEVRLANLTKAVKLDEFFRPLEQSAILWSGTVGSQPDQSVFARAARQWRVTPSECLFVGVAEPSLRDVRSHGPALVGFGVPLPDVPTFPAWLEGPARIARIITPDQERNLEKALSFQLELTWGLSNFKCLSKTPGVLHGRASQLVPLDAPALKGLKGVYASITSDVTVTCEADGSIRFVHAASPTQGDLDEAASNVLNLVGTGQLSPSPDVTVPGVTHAIQTDSAGKKIIVRQRYA